MKDLTEFKAFIDEHKEALLSALEMTDCIDTSGCEKLRADLPGLDGAFNEFIEHSTEYPQGASSIEDIHYDALSERRRAIASMMLDEMIANLPEFLAAEAYPA